ncbi:hypothetical protein LZ31DRAFT_318282 [Colletotrichum somersetense]|nr:hypothetical protein LZ31DRAFT_318282 [Colletotrichum somersetense]
MGPKPHARVNGIFVHGGIFREGHFQPSSPSAHSSSSTKDHQHPGNRRCISRLCFFVFYLLILIWHFILGRQRAAITCRMRPSPVFLMLFALNGKRERERPIDEWLQDLFSSKAEGGKKKTGYDCAEQDGAGAKGNRGMNRTQRDTEMGNVQVMTLHMTAERVFESRTKDKMR